MIGAQTEDPETGGATRPRHFKTPELDLEIAPDDPLLEHLLRAPAVVEVHKLELVSPALEALKAAGIEVIVPLISQGELVGLLNLGPRMSELAYSPDDRRLLHNLAAQTAPALRVAQLARQQQSEARERERIEQELRVARVIQETLLPRQLPQIENWRFAAHWQPARAVGGDFYDFIYYPDGRVGLFIGDVTDKGVPAAMVMATTRSLLRSSAEGQGSPGEVLAQANELLCPDIPRNMFVTCLYAVLSPKTGNLVFANAGHNLPYLFSMKGVTELRARGMPLGLMPGMGYEEIEIALKPGDRLVFFSDGLTEAHDPQGEMFGIPRLRTILAAEKPGADLIADLLRALKGFTGPDWEQEDDVTIVTLSHTPEPVIPKNGGEPDLRLLTAFELPSQPGNERLGTQRIIEALQAINLSPRQLERLKTAAAETIMNAMEHGNRYDPNLPVEVEVRAAPGVLRVTIIDQGGPSKFPEVVAPDVEAKLSGQQPPRGWGLFLIKNMVDEMEISADETRQRVTLTMHLE